MFFRLLILGIIIIFFYLWGDYIKILIYLELLRLLLLLTIMLGLKLGLFSYNYFFRCMIFLVCESSIGFLLFIYYIRIEYEMVKKLALIQF